MSGAAAALGLARDGPKPSACQPGTQSPPARSHGSPVSSSKAPLSPRRIEATPASRFLPKLPRVVLLRSSRSARDVSISLLLTIRIRFVKSRRLKNPGQSARHRANRLQTLSVTGERWRSAAAGGESNASGYPLVSAARRRLERLVRLRSISRPEAYLWSKLAIRVW